jgi:hypothetical protein
MIPSEKRYYCCIGSRLQLLLATLLLLNLLVLTVCVLPYAIIWISAFRAAQLSSVAQLLPNKASSNSSRSSFNIQEVAAPDEPLNAYFERTTNLTVRPIAQLKQGDMALLFKGACACMQTSHVFKCLEGCVLMHAHTELH